MKCRQVLSGLLLLCLLAGCQQQSHWYGTDISGLMPDLRFELSGVDGAPLSEAGLAGKSVMLFFGYTSCPDVCPATLTRLAQARAALSPAEQDKLVILFVSVDPKRDTPARLAQYTHFFGAGIVAASGSAAQLDAITSRYRTSYSYGAADASGNYVVNHGSGIYGFDSHGKVHLLIMGDASLSIEQLAADMRQLVQLSTS